MRPSRSSSTAATGIARRTFVAADSPISRPTAPRSRRPQPRRRASSARRCAWSASRGTGRRARENRVGPAEADQPCRAVLAVGRVLSLVPRSAVFENLRLRLQRFDRVRVVREDRGRELLLEAGCFVLVVPCELGRFDGLPHVGVESLDVSTMAALAVVPDLDRLGGHAVRHRLRRIESAFRLGCRLASPAPPLLRLRLKPLASRRHGFSTVQTARSSASRFKRPHATRSSHIATKAGA